MASKMPRLTREKLAFLYSSALEAGDFEMITSILDQAVHDSVLAQMLQEIDEVYERELDQTLHPEQSLPAQKHHPRISFRPVYWVTLAAAVTLIFVVILRSRSSDTSEGTGASLTPIVTVTPADDTPTPTLTPTAPPASQTPAPTLNIQLPPITLPPVVIPALDIEIPAVSVPGVEIPAVNIHIPEVVVTVDVNPWGDQP